MINTIEVYKWLRSEYRNFHRKVFFIKDVEDKFGTTYSIAQHNVKAIVRAEFAEDVPCGGKQKKFALTNKFVDDLQLPLLCLRTFGAYKSIAEVARIIGEPEPFVGMALRTLVFDGYADWIYSKNNSGTKLYFASHTETYSPF